MCLLGHPMYFIGALKNERFTYDDGLFQRILMCAPSPPKVKAEEIRTAPGTIISLHCLFYIIHKIHLTKRVNSFSVEGNALIDHEFDEYRNFVELANRHDPYLG